MIDFSVIIPMYNAANTIIEAISSVVADCRCNPYRYEIIIIDDGSTDQSYQLVQQYIDENPNLPIHLIRQVNQGASCARNNGINHAKGTFILFNDSDDRWLPGKIQFQMQYMLDHPEIVLAGAIYGNDNMGKLKRISIENRITIQDQIFKNYFSPPTVILRAAILEKTGLFNSKLRHSEELYFFNNIVFHGQAVLLNKKVAEPITNKARWGDNGLSGNLTKMELGELFTIRSAYQFGYISFATFIAGITFSLIKYARRCVIKAMHIRH